MVGWIYSPSVSVRSVLNCQFVIAAVFRIQLSSSFIVTSLRAIPYGIAFLISSAGSVSADTDPAEQSIIINNRNFSDSNGYSLGTKYYFRLKCGRTRSASTCMQKYCSSL
jgi:hypothetical protein